MRTIQHTSFFLLLTVCLIQLSFGQRTIRMNIEQVIADAGIIVHGTVARVESGTDSVTQIVSTFVTIDVIEDLYGAGSDRITLKMIGGSSKKKTIRFAGMTQFAVGEEFIGMFFTPSAAGFTSPVGMSQGKFQILTDSSTRSRSVRLSAKGSSPFDKMKHPSALAHQEWLTRSDQSIDAADFTATVRSLIKILKK